MNFIMIGIFLAAFAIGGPLVGALCGAAGIVYIFYLNFKLGPKLTLIAIPVVICFFICSMFEDFVFMYLKHVLIYVVVCMVITIAACHYYYEEDYKGIVIGVTAGFTLFTMVVLAVWMYNPRDFSVPARTNSIVIRNVNENSEVLFENSARFDEIIEELEEIEMQGSFEELVVNNYIRNDTYRITFLNKNGKEIKTYYFINRSYMSKEKGKKYVYYTCPDDNRFPYEYIENVYRNAQM